MQEVRLSERERALMRRVLESAMRARPPQKSPIRVTPSPIIFFIPRIASALAFVLILAIVGGGTAYAAEGAVPGDFLYPIKVSVNEKVVAALAQSAESKATVHARFAERRMQEAEALSARGTMTAEAKVALEERFNDHAQVVEEAVAAVEEENPIAAADISARFESAVGAHSAVIARLSEKGEDTESRRESENLSRTLRERGRRLARAETPVAPKVERSRALETAQFSAEDATMTRSAALPADDTDAEVVARIELTASTTLKEAEAHLSALRERLGATTSARTKAQISNIRGLIKKLHEDKGGSSKKGRIERALNDAVTVKTFLEAQEKFREHILLPAPDIESNGNDDESGDSDTQGDEQKEGKKGWKEKEEGNSGED